MVKRQKRIIFFPNEVGLAHLTRSYALAEELNNRGHKVIFAVPKRKRELFRSKDILLIPIEPYTTTDSLQFIPKIRQYNFLIKYVHEELKILQKFTPDVAIVDFRMSAVASCSIYGLPAFFLTGSGGLPSGCYLPNPKVPEYLFELISPLIQKIISRMRSSFIHSIHEAARSLGYSQDIDAMLHAINYLVPEAKSYLPPVKSQMKISYVGPIFWDGFEKLSPPWLSHIHPDGKSVYVTFGGTGFDRQKMIQLTKLLLQKGFRVIVSTSSIAAVSDFPHNSKLFVEKYLPGIKISRKVDLVVCHGGYGTLMEAVYAGTPSLAIPYNPDQILHSLRLQELEVTTCLIGFNRQVLLGLLQQEMNQFLSAGSNIEISRIAFEIDKTLAKKQEYQNAIGLFKNTFPLKDGVINAATIIENL